MASAVNVGLNKVRARHHRPRREGTRITRICHLHGGQVSPSTTTRRGTWNGTDTDSARVSPPLATTEMTDGTSSRFSQMGRRYLAGNPHGSPRPHRGAFAPTHPGSNSASRSGGRPGRRPSTSRR